MKSLWLLKTNIEVFVTFRKKGPSPLLMQQLNDKNKIAKNYIGNHKICSITLYYIVKVTFIDQVLKHIKLFNLFINELLI